MSDVLLGLLLLALLGVWVLLFWPQKRVTDEEIKKIEAMGRAGVYRADRMTRDMKPSDSIRRPIQENGFEQHKKVVDKDKNTL